MIVRKFVQAVCRFGWLLSLPLLAAAQGTPQGVQLANLRSDIDRLDQIVRALRLEVEALQRENRELREFVQEQLRAQSDDAVTRDQVTAIISRFEQRMQEANQANHQAIILEVAKEIEALAEQTRTAIQALSRSVAAQPQLQQVVTFNDDFPTTGITYTVKAGDTLGRIARENKSQVAWIRNANRLANDTIFPGQELFIPIQR